MFKKKQNIFNGIHVIGDSHARSFSYNSNFLPLFLGPGKNFNFVSDENLNNLINSTVKLLNLLDPENVLFVFGEADTRYYLGKGWHPWKTTLEKTPDDFYHKVEKSIDRYARYLEVIEKYSFNKIILGIIPTIRPEQNAIASYYNSELKIFTANKNIHFINVFESMLDQENKIRDEYRIDQVHASNRVQKIVEQNLIEKGILNESAFDKSKGKSSEELRKEFIFNTRFGCYEFKG